MEKLIKELEKKIKTIKIDKIKELAFEYIDEDWKTKEQILEEHLDYIAEIEEADVDNYSWNSWYARWYEVALYDILFDLKKKYEHN